MSAGTQVIVSSSKIHVLQQGTKIWDAIQSIANCEVNDDAFYVLDVDDIVRKHNEWRLKLPRVNPFYGISQYQTSSNIGCIVIIGLMLLFLQL